MKIIKKIVCLSIILIFTQSQQAHASYKKPYELSNNPKEMIAQIMKSFQQKWNARIEKAKTKIVKVEVKNETAKNRGRHYQPSIKTPATCPDDLY